MSIFFSDLFRMFFFVISYLYLTILRNSPNCEIKGAIIFFFIISWQKQASVCVCMYMNIR